MRFLLEIADRVSGRKDDFALKVLVYSGDDFHQRRLARPVQADDADLRAVEKRQVNVVQYLFLVRESLADPHHREYDFFVRHRFSVGEFRVDRKDTQKRWNITAEISAIRSFYSGRPLRPGSTLLKNTGRLSNTEGSEKYGPKPYFVMRRNKMRVRSEKSTGRASGNGLSPACIRTRSRRSGRAPIERGYAPSEAGSRFLASISLKYLYVPTFSSSVASSSHTMIPLG